MGKFFRNFGLGIVYVILLPFLLVIFVFMGIYGLFSNLLIGIRGIGRFFKGESFFATLPEDKLIAIAEKAQRDAMLNPTPKEAPAPEAPQHVYVQNNYYQSPAPNPTAPAPSIPQNQPIEGTANYINPGAPLIDNTKPNALPNEKPEATMNQIPFDMEEALDKEPILSKKEDSDKQ